MAMTKYPDVEGFAYSFARGELSCGVHIYTAIGGVDTDQPTEEGVVKGTRSYPLARTPGTMNLGAGTVKFTDEGERQRFVDDLGNNWREKVFTLKWILTAPGRPNITKVAVGCRCLSDPTSDEEGPDPIGGDITFSYMYQTRNGKVPHSGLPSPTRV